MKKYIIQVETDAELIEMAQAVDTMLQELHKEHYDYNEVKTGVKVPGRNVIGFNILLIQGGEDESSLGGTDDPGAVAN